MKTSRSNFVRAGLVFGLGALSACGGGGGGGGGGTVAPSNLSYPDDTEYFLIDVPAAPNTPTYAGDAATFSIAPALPTGLTLDAGTGRIAGIPTQSTARTVHTVTAANGGGSTTTSLVFSVRRPPRFAYITNQVDSTITICSVDADSGRVRHEGYRLGPASESGPERMVVDPSGQFAYVPNQNSSNVSVYRVDALEGWLTPGTPAGLGSGPHDAAIDPTGEFLYATSQNSNQVHVFSIDSNTGALGLVQLVPTTGVQPSACAVDPLGKFLFVAFHGNPGTGQGSAVQSFAIDPALGSLTAVGAPLSLNAFQPTDVTVDPLRGVIYLTLERFDDVVPVNFDPSSGALTLRQADNTGDRPVALVEDPTGRFTYVANRNDGTVSCFAVDETNGDLTFVSSVTAGSGTLAIDCDPSGRFVFVLNTGSQTMLQYRIDETTGGLVLEESLITRAGPSHVAFAQGAHPVARVPRFVHVAASSSDEVPTYTIQPATGVLTEVPNPPLTEDRPVCTARDPMNRFLYVVSQEGRSIEGFTIAIQNGLLTPVGLSVSTTGKPTHAVVDPSGRFLYVAMRDAVAPNDGWITTWAINQNGGSVALIDSDQIGPRSVWVGIDPTGTFVYVANKGSGPGTATISILRSSPIDGMLTISGTPIAAPGITALGFNPYRPVLYAVLDTANAVFTYTIDPGTGDLDIIAGGASNSGLQPNSIAVSPDGHFAYVTYFDGAASGHVSAWPVNRTTGQLVAGADVQYLDGAEPSDLDLDGSGRLLYVTNSGSNDVSVFEVDPATGVLTLNAPKPTGLEPLSISVTTVKQ